MQDRDLVAAIVAGDPAGLAAAYDRYASALYAYCRTVLRDPEDAADALQDTFVVAAQKLDGLRDPDRFRPWLYAVARNECLRRVRGRASTVELDQAGEVSDDGVDVDASLHEADVRSLIWAAIKGLNESEREVFELNVRHELEGADLAAALGVTPNHAHALLSRARGTLEKSLGALLVARTGKEDCPELAILLIGWDGELTALLRKRINRHIEDCGICGERKRRELRPEALLGALPVLLLPAGLRAKVMHLVGYSVPPQPPSQGQAQGQGQGQGQEQGKGQNQGQNQSNTGSGNSGPSSSSSSSASGASSLSGVGVSVGGSMESVSEYCKHIGKRAEPFDREGFPVPLDHRRRPFAAARRKSLAAAVLVLLLLLGVGGYTAMKLISPTTTADVATPSHAPSTLVITVDSSSPVQVVISTSPPSTSASPSSSPSTSPSPSAVQVVVVQTSAKPSRSPSRSPSPSPPPPPGTLVVTFPTSTPYTIRGTSSANGVFGFAATITIKAEGGAVASWSIGLPATPPSVAWSPYANPPAGGPLPSASSTTITLGTLGDPRPIPIVFTIEPGGIQILFYPLD
jgi:RNA polymerase sigma factor (sigma-70 family)